jgi:MerR family mercuric resistance operon transcriptional regulator
MNRDTIGGLADAAGVGVETVRYYQRRGLLSEPARPRGEVRRYGQEDLKRLRFIRSAQAAGFTLAEIGTLLDLDASDDRPLAYEMAADRVAALDRKIAELRQVRRALSGLAAACAGRQGAVPDLDRVRARARQDRLGACALRKLRFGESEPCFPNSRITASTAGAARS